jgi:CTP synthase
VASQYHPEFKSRPERPAPLFREFVGAACAYAGAEMEEVRSPEPAGARPIGS